MIYLVIALIFVPSSASARSTYEIIRQDQEFSGFYDLIKHNRDARNTLSETELTVFIPTNNALFEYDNALHSELAFYHMALGPHFTEDLKKTGNLTCTNSKFPKLWVTRTAQSLYVNNAEIVSSFHTSTSASNGGGEQQVYYFIDRVLDPLIRSPHFAYTAYDFMTSIHRWNLEPSRDVSTFLYKVKTNNLTRLFDQGGGNTYFIPVDQGMDPHKFKVLNKYSIYGHIVPNVVLFTRPTTRRFNYETVANDDFVYIVVSFEKHDEKLYVKGSTVLGNDRNPQGEFLAEILHPDIPVRNGVVHLIAEPLGIFKRALKPFPYVSVKERLSSDPDLSRFYDIGETTGFNSLFTTNNVTFTYFVPSDYGWDEIRKNQLELTDPEVDIMKRHLIISNTPFYMERLLAMTKTRNNTEVELKTVGGFIKLKVHLINDVYYLQWHNKLIKVLRPNYECTDGILHVLAGPIANFKGRPHKWMQFN